MSQPEDKYDGDTSDHYRTRRNIVNLGRAGLTPTQERYSTLEQKALAIVHAVTKSDFYLKHSKKVIVFSDNKNILDTFKMSLHDIKNYCLVKFREKFLGDNL